jgi:hypothetical protein
MYKKVQQDIAGSELWPSILKTRVPPSSLYFTKLDLKLQSFVNILASVFKVSKTCCHQVRDIISDFQSCPLLFRTIDDGLCQEEFSKASGHIREGRTDVNEDMLKLEENEAVDVKRIVFHAIEIAQWNYYEYWRKARRV